VLTKIIIRLKFNNNYKFNNKFKNYVAFEKHSKSTLSFLHHKKKLKLKLKKIIMKKIFARFGCWSYISAF
jgi:hypothetical protein